MYVVTKVTCINQLLSITNKKVMLRSIWFKNMDTVNTQRNFGVVFDIDRRMYKSHVCIYLTGNNQSRKKLFYQA